MMLTVCKWREKAGATEKYFLSGSVSDLVGLSLSDGKIWWEKRRVERATLRA